MSWCGVNGIIAGFQERAREDEAVLLIYVWHSVVIDFGCVSSGILWIGDGVRVGITIAFGVKG